MNGLLRGEVLGGAAGRRLRPAWWGAAALAGLMCAAMTLPAVADDDRKDAAALTILETANEHYKAKRFAKAEQLYLTAFEVSKNPAYLFNAGRAAQRAFALDRAEKHFQHYLSKELNNPKGVARARLHLQEVDEARSALKRASESAAAGQPAAVVPTPAAPQVNASKPAAAQPVPVDAAREEPTPVQAPKPAAAGVATESSASWRGPAGWAATGVGAAVAGYGAWVLITALIDRGDMDAELAKKDDAGKITGLQYAVYRDWEEASNDEIVWGHTLLWPGVALLGAGAWLLLGDHKQGQAAFVPAPGGGSLHVALRF